MTVFILYLLKIIVCSGILFLYYRVALYNRLFHQWNRVFLLGAVLISLFIPLVQFHLPDQSYETKSNVIRLLDVVTSEEDFLHEGASLTNNELNLSAVTTVVYFVVVAIMLFFLLHGLYKLWVLYRTHTIQKFNGIHIIHTWEKDAPFSFFRNIFWNSKVDLHSPAGNRILHHEIAHVRELHSADRLLMNIILVFFWCNPFYWLIRKEMNLVHEFIADRRTIKDQDLTAFSEMVLCAAFPRYQFGLTSNFSSSSIKRRLFMLTKWQHPKVNYLGRLFILPVLFLIFVAFTLRTKNATGSSGSSALISVKNTITVVIDAGHGGDNNGAVAADGTREKDLNLAIAKKILQRNTNKNIRILLTREEDNTHPIRERVDWTVKEKPDAFISIHVGAGPKYPSGFELIVTKKNSDYAKQSQLLGTLVAQEMRKIYHVSPELKKGGDNGNGIWVLDAPTINYPALLIECGNLSDQQDLAYLNNPANQEKIADQILIAIALFAGTRKD